MAGYDDDYDGLKSLIIRDQFFITCDRQLQTFLKEKGKLSLKEMAKATSDFYEAHGYPSDSHEPSKKPNGNMKQPTLNSVNHRTHSHLLLRTPEHVAVTIVGWITTIPMNAGNCDQIRTIQTAISSASDVTVRVTKDISVP